MDWTKNLILYCQTNQAGNCPNCGIEKFADIPYVRPDMDAVLDSVKAAIHGLKTAKQVNLQNGLIRHRFTRINTQAKRLKTPEGQALLHTRCRLNSDHGSGSHHELNKLH